MRLEAREKPIRSRDHGQLRSIRKEIVPPDQCSDEGLMAATPTRRGVCPRQASAP